jgi:hypothetical protein
MPQSPEREPGRRQHHGSCDAQAIARTMRQNEKNTYHTNKTGGDEEPSRTPGSHTHCCNGDGHYHIAS